MRTTRLKDLCLTATFVFITVCAMMFAGCPLEDNDALWKKVAGEQGNTPTGITATATSSSSITVSWNSVSGAYGYIIYRSSSASDTYSQVSWEYSTLFTDTGLSANTTYYYKVAADFSIDGGVGPQSSYASATTWSSSGGGGVPSAPTGVTATAASSSSITVSWNSVSGATNYYIYRSLSASGSYSYIDQAYSSTSYTDTGLSANTTYYYRVAATNSYGDSSQSAYVSATTLSSGGGVPSAPTGVTASAASSSSITVSWNSVSGATNYYIYRSLSASGSYSYIDQAYSSTSYTDTGLSANTTYYYRVAAVNNSGTGSQSTTASATTLSSISGPVNVPGATLTAKLSWLGSNAQSGGNYIVEVNANESIDPMGLSYGDVTITLRGTGSNRTISLSSNGSMFTIYGITLILGNNITLQGRNSNTDELVYVGLGGTLEMNNGSTITGNTYGGVMVNQGTFTMSGGTISDNTASYGGGVDVTNGGIFTMSGGTISGNTASYGGGVHIYDSGSSPASFTMSGGTISGNTASVAGGGVWIGNTGVFTKTGGTITGSNASNGNVAGGTSNSGHAVYADNYGSTVKRRETTAGPSVNLSFNGSNGTFSGGWETSSDGGGENFNFFSPNDTFSFPEGVTFNGHEITVKTPTQLNWENKYTSQIMFQKAETQFKGGYTLSVTLPSSPTVVKITAEATVDTAGQEPEEWASQRAIENPGTSATLTWNGTNWEGSPVSVMRNMIVLAIEFENNIVGNQDYTFTLNHLSVIQ